MTIANKRMPDSCLNLMNSVKNPATMFDTPADELLQRQLQAAQDLFEQRRAHIPVLEQRAADTGITKLRSKADLVPLLFSHTTYKSYPESLVVKGRWPLLTKWYETLSAVPIEVDLTGVTSVDDWVDRLWSAGHYLYATSGTTGKCSFLNHTQGDREFVETFWRNCTGWPHTLEPDGEKMRYYCGVPEQGPQAPMHWFKYIGEVFGAEGQRFHFGREPIRVSFLNRVGAMRKAMASGEASAADIAQFEQDMAAREKIMLADIRTMAEDILEHRHEPLFISTWQIMEDVINIAREAGIADGDFKDVFLFGSGRKKFRGKLEPKELDDAAMRFFGPENVRARNMFYGMTELGTTMLMCEAGHYHVPPWIVLLLLDKNGNALVEKAGEIVEGRGGFFDLSREGRWGGIITGDKLQVNFSPVCACGRPGPAILDTVDRYTDVGSDKVDCAGGTNNCEGGVVLTVSADLPG